MQPKQLSRSMIDRTFGGVCGGLGDYLSINAWWVRLTFILFSFFTVGVTVIIYLVLWLIIPQQTPAQLAALSEGGQASAETLILLGGGVILLGVAVLAVSLGVLQGTRGDILLPFLLIALGIVLFAVQVRTQS